MDNNNVDSSLEIFKKSVTEFYPSLPEGDLAQLAKVMHYKKYSKGEIILQEGKVCRHYCFQFIRTP
jgi:CRP-like cAMP-binding protein